MAQTTAPRSLGLRASSHGSIALAGLAAWLPLACLGPVLAAPVVCTTTLEAPAVAGQLVDVTRCGAVVTTPQVVQQRFYTYTAPFVPGVDLTHQVTDLLGLSLGGGDGSGKGGKVMGFGFPDQTIVWDSTALQNTYQVLLEQQSDPLPWRTPDVGNGFGSSLAAGASTGRATVQGLW